MGRDGVEGMKFGYIIAIAVGAVVFVTMIFIAGLVASPLCEGQVENVASCDEFLTVHNVTGCNATTLFMKGNLACMEHIYHENGIACNISCKVR